MPNLDRLAAEGTPFTIDFAQPGRRPNHTFP